MANWENVWRALSKIKHTVFNDNFYQNGASIYLSLQDFSRTVRRYRNSFQGKLEAAVKSFIFTLFNVLYCLPSIPGCKFVLLESYAVFIIKTVY